MARITKLRVLKHMAARQGIFTDRSSSSSPSPTAELLPTRKRDNRIPRTPPESAESEA